MMMTTIVMIMHERLLREELLKLHLPSPEFGLILFILVHLMEGVKLRKTDLLCG